MNIRIDKTAGISILELARFAECHGCELINQNNEILIRLKRNANVGDIESISLDTDFGLPLTQSNTVNRRIG